jgi:hypothetical protein
LSHPGMTLFATTALLFAVPPVRKKLIAGSKQKLYQSALSVAGCIRAKVRNFILGSLPQLLSDTQESVTLNTHKLELK